MLDAAFRRLASEPSWLWCVFARTSLKLTRKDPAARRVAAARVEWQVRGDAAPTHIYIPPTHTRQHTPTCARGHRTGGTSSSNYCLTSSFSSMTRRTAHK